MEDKELFNRAKAAYGTGAYDDATLEFIFPELKESEDERIRKVLIHIVKSACSKYGIKYIGDKITEEMLLAYLEKQKEQKPADGKELLYVSNKSYNLGYRDGKREAEQKPEWSEEDENTIQEIIGCIEQARADSHLSEDHCLRLETFLYEHYRHHWKPSEEQMKAFKDYIKDSQEKAEAAVGGWDNFDVMIHLYEQLKKL